ncbi:hypothetical protein ACRYCC_28140 [Actinomadura scrupuli]|uniref:hypothetical protein n=1 Tax=Actinomadura scrupuli TaxID=559629 RepID=UPI003D997907
MIGPAPDTFVLLFHRLRPGFEPEQRPRFRDLAWRLALMSPKESNRSLVVDWSRCPAGLRPGLTRAAFAELNVPTPGRPAPAACLTLDDATVHAAPLLPDVDRFASWLAARGTTEFPRSPPTIWMPTPSTCAHGRRCRTDAKSLWVISRLWAYAPHLPRVLRGRDCCDERDSRPAAPHERP